MSSKAKTGRINDVDTYYKVEPVHETPLVDILILILIIKRKRKLEEKNKDKYR